MCGIVAVLNLDGSPVDPDRLVRMRDQMIHRGPDDAGVFTQDSVGLAHRRLSILDLSEAGHQPMSSADGRLWLTFNGEIFNYVELASELRSRGHRFKSQTDSEVILHLYEEMGEECLERLNGMFGFALWDAREKKLFCARDRIGVKPFHYYLDDRRFICASEIKAILEDPDVPAQPDMRGLADYFFAGHTLGSKTPFSGIQQLQPGHSLSIQDGRVRVLKYWDVRYRYEEHDGRALTDELSSLIEDAVRIHCRSDAPLGCHLSGGLDSSTVASFAADHQRPLKTFSVRFSEGGYFDETAHAKRVAQVLGAEYFETAPGAPEFIARIAKLHWHMEMPIPGIAGFDYYSAARLASQHAKVSLTGHGGDELFAGYPPQFHAAFGNTDGFDLSQRPEIRSPKRPRRRAWLERRNLRSRLMQWINPEAVPRRLQERWIQFHCRSLPQEDALFHADFVTALADYSPRDEYLAPLIEAPTDQTLDRLLYHDLRSYLPELLHKEDRASMAVSLETRLPLLDYRIVEFLATVHPEQKVPNQIPKALLRSVAAARLPDDIVQRRDKSAFPVPIERWTAGEILPLIRKVVFSPTALDRGIFDPDVLRSDRVTARDLLSALNVELWFRIFIDRDPDWCDSSKHPSRSSSSPS